jgi:hypothetical protein
MPAYSNSRELRLPLRVKINVSRVSRSKVSPILETRSSPSASSKTSRYIGVIDPGCPLNVENLNQLEAIGKSGLDQFEETTAQIDLKPGSQLIVFRTVEVGLRPVDLHTEGEALLEKPRLLKADQDLVTLGSDGGTETELLAVTPGNPSAS